MDRYVLVLSAHLFSAVPSHFERVVQRRQGIFRNALQRLPDCELKFTHRLEVSSEETALLEQTAQILVACENRFSNGVACCQELCGVGKDFCGVFQEVVRCLLATVHDHGTGNQGRQNQNEKVRPPWCIGLFFREFVLRCEAFASKRLEGLDALSR